MKNSTSKNEDWELRPGGMLVQRREPDDVGGDSGPLIKVNVSHGSSQHEIDVPARSTFGYMKEAIEQKTGLEPKNQNILFRGKEKEDGEYLHEAGVKDKSKVLIFENPVSEGKKLEEMKESEGTSDTQTMKEQEETTKVYQAIAKVREEIDKLADRVGALEVAVNGGTKVADEEFVISSELLMRQLLKLDTIEADGEAKVQRKAEVRRVQNLHEVLDNLKATNSKPLNNSSNTVSVTTEWETFDSGLGSLSPPPVTSSTTITQDWERFD